jgi:hypothetical protein
MTIAVDIRRFVYFRHRLVNMTGNALSTWNVSISMNMDLFLESNTTI